MQRDPELDELGMMMGASQTFSDQEAIAMLCPDLSGKSIRELTNEELRKLLSAAEKFTVLDDDED